MKKLLLLLCLSVSLFAQGSFSGSTNYYRTNEPRYEHRFNVITNAGYGRAFYFGDWILNMPLGEPYFDKKQFKNMAGVNLIGDFSARYQNDDFHDDKLVNGKIKTKEFNENRYGLGYKLVNNFGSVTMMNDFMYLKSDLADRRSEWNFGLNSQYVQVKHQLWYDYQDGHVKQWYEKLIVGYKVRPNVQLQWRSEWQPNKKRVDMVGLGISY